jgi:hypothetical protein
VVGHLPPSPFFSAKGEFDRVGGIRRVKVVQVRLVECLLAGIPGAECLLIDIDVSGSKRCSRGEYDDTVDESHVGVRTSMRGRSVRTN